MSDSYCCDGRALEVRVKEQLEVAAVDVMSDCGVRDSMLVQLASSLSLQVGRWHPEAGLVSRARRDGDWWWIAKGIVKPRGGQRASRAGRWRLSPGGLGCSDVWLGGLSSELGGATSGSGNGARGVVLQRVGSRRLERSKNPAVHAASSSNRGQLCGTYRRRPASYVIGIIV